MLTNARQMLDKKGKEAKKEGKDFQKKLICSILKEANYVIFEFSDNAYGVPDEIKTRVFDPFFYHKRAWRRHWFRALYRI